MRYEVYTLQIKRTIENSIGQKIDTWDEVQDILVATSQNFYTEVVNDVLYRKFAPSGITPYKGLDKSKTYKIVNAKHSYLVDSFNTDSRLTQLILKEVV